MGDDDKKTIKFQMMMSPAEAEALDEWGFERRIRSRAEAIRRLCQLGLLYFNHQAPMQSAIDSLIDEIGPRIKTLEKMTAAANVPAVHTAIAELRAEFAERTRDMAFINTRSMAEALTIVKGGNFENDLAVLQALKKEISVLKPQQDAYRLIEIIKSMSG